MAELIKPLSLAFVAVLSVKLIDPSYSHLAKWLTYDFFVFNRKIRMDTWAVTHIALFAHLSKKYPGHRAALFAAGLAWEVVEAWFAAHWSADYWEEPLSEQMSDALLWNISGILIGTKL